MIHDGSSWAASNTLTVANPTPIQYNWQNSQENWVGTSNANFTIGAEAVTQNCFATTSFIASQKTPGLSLNSSDYTTVTVTLKNPTANGSGVVRLYIFPPGANGQHGSHTCYYTFTAGTAMTDYVTYTIDLTSTPADGTYSGTIGRVGFRAPWGVSNGSVVYWKDMTISGSSGTVSIAGNLSVSGTISGTVSSSTTASTATTLSTARNIGGVSFDGSADIDLPGVNTTGNQNTTGSAATVTGAAQTAITSVGTLTALTLGTGAVDLGTGTVAIGGDVTIAAGKDLNMSGPGSLTVGTGATSLGGSLSVTGTSTLSTVNATTLQIGGTSINATAAELNTYVLNVDLDDISATGSGKNKCFVVVPKAGTITKIYSIICSSTATSDAVITANVNGGSDITNTITIASGSTAGTIDVCNPSDNNTVNAGDYIRLITNGGNSNEVKAVFTIEITY